MATKIAIIGSGFLGLTLALRFVERGHAVTIFEAAPEIGGLAAAWDVGDIVWDKHYHVTLLSDSFTRKIVEDIGLGNEFEWVQTKTGFFTDGKLYSMSDSLEFLKFPPLGLVSKLRLGGTIFYASKVTDWKSLESILVEDWLTKLSGKKTFDKIWRPLLKAKLGGAYKESSAAFIWATIQRMYAARNSGLKKEMFGYVRGGYARVLKRFEQILREKGVEIRLEGKVESIGRSGSSINVESAGILSDKFDKVILTCTPRVAAAILPQLGVDERELFESVRYQGIVCASLLLKERLSNFYVTNITDDTPFTGIIEMSAMVDRTEFGGRSLVYLPKYVPAEDPLFKMSDSEIEERFLDALSDMYPHFSRADVEAFRISRVKEVFPVPLLDYSKRLPPVETSIDGLFVLNSAQIKNGTLNVNETVQLAEDFVSANPF